MVMLPMNPKSSTLTSDSIQVGESWTNNTKKEIFWNYHLLGWAIFIFLREQESYQGPKWVDQLDFPLFPGLDESFKLCQVHFQAYANIFICFWTFTR